MIAFESRKNYDLGFETGYVQVCRTPLQRCRLNILASGVGEAPVQEIAGWSCG